MRRAAGNATKDDDDGGDDDDDEDSDRVEGRRAAVDSLPRLLKSLSASLIRSFVHSELAGRGSE